jgi:hypothetical protein
MRTRRPRPSEKITLRVIPGFSPQGHFTLEGPRGGAGSARPQRGPRLDGHMPPVGHWASVCPSVSMLCMGLRQASLCGRGDRVPPRKSPSALSQGFPRKAILPWRAPAEGGSARPLKNPWAWPRHDPSRPLGVRLPPVSMPFLGLRRARFCGRGDRVPPTNPPLAHSGVYHIRPSFLGAHPRGGAGSARPLKNAWAWPRHDPSRPLGVRLPLREHVVHRFASGQSLRTRRPRPSEKITLRAVPSSSPQGHPSLHSPPWRGGLRTPAKNPPG